MKNFTKNIAITSILLLASSAIAADRDYNANYYEEQDSLLFKIRGFYVSAPTELEKNPTTSGATKVGNMVEVGYGFDTAVTYFLTDHFATELSLGLASLKVKSTAMQKAASAYGDGSGVATKNNNIYLVPAAAILQYHVAPFGGVRPYVGIGYHGTYAYTRSKAFKVKPGHGAVAQIGVDFVEKDDTLITFDVRQYFLESKVTLKRNFLYPSDTTQSAVSSKVKLNPLVISMGIGFKF
ncbi:MAG: OmpW family outer membrane protein [Rickettsiaceae bacterium]|nr:OmpW family outer membrane protein [Rickettsiaceae bacterium]